MNQTPYFKSKCFVAMADESEWRSFIHCAHTLPGYTRAHPTDGQWVYNVMRRIALRTPVATYIDILASFRELFFWLVLARLVSDAATAGLPDRWLDWFDSRVLYNASTTGTHADSESLSESNYLLVTASFCPAIWAFRPRLYGSERADSVVRRVCEIARCE